MVAKTTRADDDASVVRRDYRTPKYGSVYSVRGNGDTAARCTNISVDQVDLFLWDVTCTYSTNHGKPEEGNPLDRPPVLAWSTAKYTKTEHFDRSKKPFQQEAGKPFVNGIGELFNPPPPMPVSNLVLTITRNEQAFHPVTAKSYINSVNTDPWFFFGVSEVKINGIKATQEEENGQGFWKTVYTFEIDDELWIPKRVLNVGTKYKDANGNIILAKDDAKVATGGKVKLNMDGTLYDPSDIIGATWIEFTLYKQRPFAPLMLP